MSELLLNPKTLRVLRAGKGWDQKTLAQAAGVDPSVISRLERGLQDDLRVSVLVGIAGALGTSVDALLSAPYGRAGASGVIPELAGVLSELESLSEKHQRQLAAILRAYLESLPEQED